MAERVNRVFVFDNGTRIDLEKVICIGAITIAFIGAAAGYYIVHTVCFYKFNKERIEQGTRYELQHDTTLHRYVRPGITIEQVARVNAIANLRKNLYFYDDAKRRN